MPRKGHHAGLRHVAELLQDGQERALARSGNPLKDIQKRFAAVVALWDYALILHEPVRAVDTIPILDSIERIKKAIEMHAVGHTEVPTLAEVNGIENSQRGAADHREWRRQCDVGGI